MGPASILILLALTVSILAAWMLRHSLRPGASLPGCGPRIGMRFGPAKMVGLGLKFSHIFFAS